MLHFLNFWDLPFSLFSLSCVTGTNLNTGDPSLCVLQSVGSTLRCNRIFVSPPLSDSNSALIQTIPYTPGEGGQYVAPARAPQMQIEKTITNSSQYCDEEYAGSLKCSTFSKGYSGQKCKRCHDSPSPLFLIHLQYASPFYISVLQSTACTLAHHHQIVIAA